MKQKEQLAAFNFNDIESRDQIYKIINIGFEGHGFACYLNSAIQFFAPAFVYLLKYHDILIEKHILSAKYLYDIYMNGSTKTRELFNDDVFDENNKYFAHFRDMIMGKMENGKRQSGATDFGDAMLIIHIFITELSNYSDAEILMMISRSKNMHNNKQIDSSNIFSMINNNIGTDGNDIYQSFIAHLKNNMECEYDNCIVEISMPKFLHIHCNKEKGYIIPNYMTVDKINYRLTGILVSTGIHATAFSLREGIWYHFNDKIITRIDDLLKNGIFNLDKYGYYLIMGLQYENINSNHSVILTINDVK